MRYQTTSPTAPSIHQVHQSVQQTLGRLMQSRNLDDRTAGTFQAARGLLESLPLSTDQFGLACRRLDNARRYLEFTEPGAARYELRLLASSLKFAADCVREPRRRLRRTIG